MSGFYRAPLDRVDTFTYPEWSGAGTITAVGDLPPFRYYHVDAGVPVPVSQEASFEPVTLDLPLAEQLRQVCPDLVRWLIVTPEESRSVALAELQQEKVRRMNAGVPFQGNRYNTNAEFLTEVMGLILGYQLGIFSGTQDIRTMDRQTVAMTQAELTALAGAIGAFRKDVHAWAWQAEDEILNQP